jgi:Delta14-sterol reductase
VANLEHPGALDLEDAAAKTAVTLRRRATALTMLVVLPALAYYLGACLIYAGGTVAAPTILFDALRAAAPTTTAVTLYGAWLLLQAALQLMAPGRIRQGTPLADGSRLSYRLNGWFSFWATCVIVLAVVRLGWISPSIAYDQFLPLLTTANITAFALSALLYWWGTRTSERGRGGDPLDGYVMGLALNPRVAQFDLKFFCESRPGLILWVLLDASCAAKQYAMLGFMTTPMLVVCAFQFLYVADYFFHEEAVLTTWDIRHERFGWMLCWGCLVWVPFTYSIQALYLVAHTSELPPLGIAAVVALNLTGYAIFRTANLQKHRFRTDPARAVWGRAPEYVRTPTGSLLLASGWWGLARHSNYLGDWMMGLAWCLATGFEHVLPYFYIAYFTILLVHRERRDYQMCLSKYGEAWESYCRKVPWRIIPGLY